MIPWLVRALIAWAVLTGMAFTSPASSRAQGFGLGTWGGSVETLVGFSRQDTETTSQKSRFERTRAEEKLTLGNSGAYIYDPRLVTLSIGGTFGLDQGWVTGDISDTREGTLWGYSLSAGFLPGQDLSLNAFANRDDTVVTRELAGISEISSQSWGTTLFVRRFYIPSTLTFRQELREEESRTGFIVSRREDRRNVVTYDGRRGWINSEVAIGYEFIDLTDEVFPNLSFQSHDGNLNYSVDFGPDLNRRWDSRLHVLNRTGVANLTIWNLNESLRIDHTKRLRSNLNYNFTRNESPGGVTTTHLGNSTLRHQLFESLVSSLQLEGTFQSLPGGDKKIADSRLDLFYTKRLPWEGRLNATLGGRFKFEDDNFQVTETFVSQEPHTFATPFAVSIPLNNPFVVTSSVVVTKIAVGPLPAGCVPAPGPPTPLVEGRDFTVRTAGDLTEIVPIPCSGATPGINPGDTIAVDYRITVSPSLTFTSTTWRANVSVDYRWIRPYFIHEQTEQDLLSGRDGQFLNDQQLDTVGTELRFNIGHFRTNFLVEARRFISDRQSFDAFQSTQSFGFIIFPGLTLDLSGAQTYTDFSRPRPQNSTTLTGRATLSYRVAAALFAEAFAAVRHFRDSLSPAERVTETGLRMEWIFRKLEVRPEVGFIDRQRGETDTREYRAVLRIIRRF